MCAHIYKCQRGNIQLLTFQEQACLYSNQFTQFADFFLGDMSAEKKFLGFRTRRKNKRSTPGVRLLEPRTEEVKPKQRHYPSGMSIRRSRKLEFSSLGGLRSPLTSNLVPCSVERRESGLWLAEGTGIGSLNNQVQRLGAWVGGVQDSGQVLSLRSECVSFLMWEMGGRDVGLSHLRPPAHEESIGNPGRGSGPRSRKGFPPTESLLLRLNWRL